MVDKEWRLYAYWERKKYMYRLHLKRMNSDWVVI